MVSLDISPPLLLFTFHPFYPCVDYTITSTNPHVRTHRTVTNSKPSRSIVELECICIVDADSLFCFLYRYIHISLSHLPFSISYSLSLLYSHSLHHQEITLNSTKSNTITSTQYTVCLSVSFFHFPLFSWI